MASDESEDRTMARNTIKVDRIKEMVNYYNANAAGTPDGRTAGNTILEVVLMECGQYKGFRYIDPDAQPADDTKRYYF
jgi:hypothetical protein